MTWGFPLQLASRVGCTRDAGTLELGPNSQFDKDCNLVRNGALVCCSCKTAFPIDDGILNMLDGVVLDNESKHEQQLRNRHASSSISVTGPAWYENEHNAMEMIPTLEALSVGKSDSILELGCGDGRYTVSVAGQCQSVVAVDFSLESLRILQQRLHDSRNVALVLGDITTVCVSAAGFNRVLSTLVSNLPTREHRYAMYQLAVHALRPDGRFVFTAHNHGLRQRLDGVSRSGRYEHGGIYRHNYTLTECIAEARSYFNRIKAVPIQIYFPFARTLGLPLVPLSRFLERIPLINQLGELILCTAEQPIRGDLHASNV